MTDRIIIDTNFMSQLYAAGGTAAWDSLLDAGDQVLLTNIVEIEILDGPFAAAFLAWRGANSASIDFREFTNAELSAFYGVPIDPLAGTNAGDFSIRYAVEGPDFDGFSYRLASSDGGLINFFSNNLSSNPYETVSGYMVDELKAGNLSSSDYNVWRANLLNDAAYLNSIPKDGRVLLDFSAGEWLDTPYNPTNLIRVGAFIGVLKELGVLGDLVDFGVTAAYASEQAEAGDYAGAEATMVGFFGSAVGGLALGTLAGAVALIFLPEPATTAAGIATAGAVIGSSLFGGYFGSQIGGEFSDYVVAELQQAYSNGDAITPDLLEALIAQFASDNGLDISGYSGELGGDGQFLNDECFPASTPITLADGTAKPIEDIRVGDEVLSFKPDGSLVSGTVDKLFRNTTQEFVRLTFDDGRDDLVATPGHRFLTETADFMEIGHMVRLGGGAVRLVEKDGSIVTARGEVLAYSAETAHLFEEAQAKATIFDGNLAVKHDAESGWATYNFERLAA